MDCWSSRSERHNQGLGFGDPVTAVQRGVFTGRRNLLFALGVGHHHNPEDVSHVTVCIRSNAVQPAFSLWRWDQRIWGGIILQFPVEIKDVPQHFPAFSPL